MKSITKLSAILISAVACASWPAMAQDSTPGSTNTAPATPRPPRAPRFSGTIGSVDSATMTLTLKARNGSAETKVKITSTTRIIKDGQPGVFADAVEGVRVSGSGKKGDDGVWTATTLRITTAPAPKPPPTTQAPSGQK